MKRSALSVVAILSLSSDEARVLLQVRGPGRKLGFWAFVYPDHLGLESLTPDTPGTWVLVVTHPADLRAANARVESTGSGAHREMTPPGTFDRTVFRDQETGEIRNVRWRVRSLPEGVESRLSEAPPAEWGFVRDDLVPLVEVLARRAAGTL